MPRFQVSVYERTISNGSPDFDERIINNLSLGKARRIERHYYRKARRYGWPVRSHNWGFTAEPDASSVSAVTIRYDYRTGA